MSRLVEKVVLPIFGEMYIANADEVSLEATQALQEIFKELYEYEDAEEKGLLAKMPCKAGDAVYEPRPDRGFISKYIIKSVEIYDGGMFFNWNLKDGIYSNLKGFNAERIGETVFLTSEEAEQKLKEMEGEAK